jgi:anti-sigma factor RsiW
METGSCPEISALSSFLDDEFEESKNDWIRLHIQNCSTCADQIHRFQAADGLIRKHLAEPMPFSDRSHTGDCISPEDMTAYLHDLLPANAKKRVEEHLDGCDACLSEFSSLAKATMQLDRSKTEPLPDGLRQRVEGLWARGQKEREQILRLVVRLAKDGLELLRDSLFPSSIAVQEMFAPVGAYRTVERSSLPSGVLLKKSLPGIELSVMLEWKAENRAGLRIRIEDEKRNPVSGQRVVLRRNEVLLYSERTSADGDVTISDLEANTYLLGIIISGKELNFELEMKEN